MWRRRLRVDGERGGSRGQLDITNKCYREKTANIPVSFLTVIEYQGTTADC